MPGAILPPSRNEVFASSCLACRSFSRDRKAQLSYYLFPGNLDPMNPLHVSITLCQVFVDSSVSTIGGGGGDTTFPSPAKFLKQPLPRIGLLDPLHCRQACPDFSSFHQGVGQISPREGLFLCRPLPKRGQNCDIPAPLPVVERLTLQMYV